MKKKSKVSKKKFVWTCLICEKPVEVYCPGDDKKASYPALNGGTIEMDFAYGSKYDNLQTGETWQGCICDACFEKKRHLTRSVLIRTCRNWEVRDVIE